jgi:hypothetical protein
MIYLGDLFARCLLLKVSVKPIEAQSGVDSLEAVVSSIDLVDRRVLPGRSNTRLEL